ncbi:MAG: 6-phosphofructokinase [Bacteroidia bacterium]|nr:6-phosphofructokinase [Bacteroidia bacterium]MDW8334077.1 6-phosphofructokinase [Bacteroidia bacterium]
MAKNIGILTSGGDSPGMNACIRAAVRAALYHGIRPFGIFRGYEGLIDGEIVPMDSRSVSNIIHTGGTILKTARSSRFRTREGRDAAYRNLQKHDIDSLVVIGGDGTYRGAAQFLQERPELKIVGCPGTIDNDLYGTDFTIGFDTAVNTAVQAIDKIRDTATSHNRLFFVEVMGRDAGFIALRTGIAAGAEAVLIPETVTTVEMLLQMLEAGRQKNKSSMIIVVAEGDEEGGAFAVAEKVKSRFDYLETKVSILGHLQRGGSPTYADRVLASRLGVAAVETLVEGASGVAVGVVCHEVVRIPFEQAVKHVQDLNPGLLRLVEILSL